MNLDIVPLALGITAVLTCLILLGKLLLTVIRAARKLGAFVDEVVGEPAQYGRPARPGLVEKVDSLVTSQAAVVETQGQHTDELAAVRAEVETVKHELFPNSGLSLRDAVDRLERQSQGTVVNVHPAPPEPPTEP